MKQLVDFNEKKAEKEGKLTPKTHLENHLENVEETDFVVTISRCKDGEIKTGWSEGQLLQILGLLEAAKQIVLNEMWEEN